MEVGDDGVSAPGGRSGSESEEETVLRDGQGGQGKAKETRIPIAKKTIVDELRDLDDAPEFWPVTAEGEANNWLSARFPPLSRPSGTGRRDAHYRRIHHKTGTKNDFPPVFWAR